MVKPKGGRGITAPYTTTMARVPAPIIDQVAQLKERYQEFLAQGGDPLAPPPLLDAVAEYKAVDEDEEDLGDPPSEETIKDQARKIQELVRENHYLNKELSEAESKIEILESEIKNQESEISSLHQKNDDLKLEILNLQNRLNRVKPVNKFNQLSTSRQDTTLENISQRSLAKRLGVTHQAITKHKLRETFSKWAKTYDPDFLEWKYNVDSKTFSIVNL